MATNAWVRDNGAAVLKELEKKYNIQLSTYVVWDGKEVALEQIMGKWDDSFDDAFSFKAEVERTNPGSSVEIEYAKVGVSAPHLANPTIKPRCYSGRGGGFYP